MTLKTEITPLSEASPEEGARRVAIAYVDEAREAAARLLIGVDPEALHDLRVALRRLRSVMRFFERDLRESVKKKAKRRLRTIARATGEGRDAEVQLAWIEAQLSRTDWTERAGARWWASSLRSTKERAYEELERDLVPELTALLPTLKESLGRFREERSLLARAPRPSFGHHVAQHLARETQELAQALTAVKTIEDESIAHQARIHGKRIRYLIEPLRDELEEAREAARILKALQEKLGDLNDHAVRTTALTNAIEAQAVDRARKLAKAATSAGDLDGPLAGEEPGLAALLREAHDRKAALLTEIIETVVTGDGLSIVISALERLGRVLTEPRAPLPLEIERKYLLHSAPPRLETEPFVRIDQGYVPGEKLHERVRRKRGAHGTTYFRTIKLGSGVSRIEVEETCDEKIFGKLWSLTAGRRVQKKRYAIADGELTWEVDVFTDRPLVLAEVELTSADQTPVLPSWLAPFVVREVTDEAAYVNLNLAR
jgi:CHAD domain-containing protein/CYTH domain-containing protein